jgi:hypothetical protein
MPERTARRPTIAELISKVSLHLMRYDQLQERKAGASPLHAIHKQVT